VNFVLFIETAQKLDQNEKKFTARKTESFDKKLRKDKAPAKSAHFPKAMEPHKRLRNDINQCTTMFLRRWLSLCE